MTALTSVVAITVTPLVDSVGTYPVSFVLTDSLMSTATYSFNVFANTAPTFTTPFVADLSLVEGFPATYTLPPFVDKEGDAITVTVDLSWIDSFATYSGGIITFTPIYGSAGIFSVPITLSDNYPSPTLYELNVYVIPDEAPII